MNISFGDNQILYTKKGWKGKAREHYQKFLGLWKDVDPGVAEVGDSRGSLIDLRK